MATIYEERREGTPIFLIGKHQVLQQAVTQIVQPEYEVIDSAYSLEEALEKLPSFLSENKIQLAIMGGGYSPADFQEALKLEGAKDIPWLRPNMPKPPPGAAGGPPQTPPTEVIANRVRKCLMEHHDEVKGGNAGGEVWLF